MISFLLVFVSFQLSAETAEVDRNPASSKRIKNLFVTGNKIIESPVIKNAFGLKEGSRYTSRSIRKGVEGVFKLEYFWDVQISETKTGSRYNLNIKVVEKPKIKKISFQGNSEVSKEDLEQEINVKVFEVLDLNSVREDKQRLQKFYEEKGYFLADVTTEIKYTKTPKEESAEVVFNIEENDKVAVHSINIIGNTKLSDEFLKGRMLLEEGGFFSSFSGGGAYKQEIFDRDLQVINYSYFNEGYIQVKIDRPEVSVTPDKKGIYITIHVTEGDQFQVGEVGFRGDLLFSDKEMLDAIVTDGEKIFAYDKLQADLAILQAKYGDLGYAFANVIPRTRVRPNDKKVDLVFEIDKGEKAYFGQINVIGNTKTRDGVIRRELSILEGELYNETKKKESIANIRRLGYFEDVRFKQNSRPGQAQVLDIEILVKERNTGTLQAGAGYSNDQKFILNAQITEQNLFGRGQKLSLNIQHSRESSTFKIGLTEPYFRDSLWSLGGDVFRYDNRNNTNRDFEDLSIGASVRAGYPVAKYTRVFGSMKFEDLVFFDLKFDQAAAVYPKETVFGTTLSVSTSVEYDSRDDRFSPSAGMFASLALEYAGLGGDIDYNRLTASYRYYKKVWGDVVWRNNLVYGAIGNPRGTKEVPFTKLFFLGGPYSLKGFPARRVGIKRTGNIDDDADIETYVFGAKQQFYYNLEFEFPLIEEAKIKGVVFYDMGNAQDELDLGDLFKDYGFGIRWFSPIGPMRFEIGYPINPDSDIHSDQNFEFSIGTPF
ncbi:MAG: outer membrane protein assembly factor BamA [Bdellovibrionales bacterium]